MDFNGKGVVKEEDFFKALIRFKIPFSQSEVSSFFSSE